MGDKTCTILKILGKSPFQTVQVVAADAPFAAVENVQWRVVGADGSSRLGEIWVGSVQIWRHKNLVWKI